MTLEDEEIFLEKVSKSENNTFIVGFVGEELVAIADVRAGSRPRIRHSGELGIYVWILVIELVVVSLSKL